MKIKNFEIHTSRRNGQFRAHAIASNGEKVWTTEQYQNKVAGAVKAIRLLDPAATKPIDIFDKNGNWTKTLPAENLSPEESKEIKKGKRGGE